MIITATAVLYRVRIFLFPDSMLGIDPDGYAIQIARVINTGDTTAITFGFYTRAPLHILEGVTFGLISSVPTSLASIIYPITAGIGIPLLAASFSFQLRPDAPQTAILAAGGASLLGYSVQFSYWPIPQMTGLLFSLFTVLAIFVYATTGNKRWLIVGVLTMVGAIYTHKLVAIATTLSVAGALVLGLLHPVTRGRRSVKRLFGGTFGLLAVLTGVQLFFLTRFGNVVVFQLVLPSVPAQTISVPTHAVDPYTFTVRIFRLSYVLLLAVMSGFVWIGGFWQNLRKDTRERDVLFLGFVSTLAGLVILVYPSGVNPVRTIFYSEVLLFTLIAVRLYWCVVESSPGSRGINRYIAVGSVLILVATAGVSPIAGPDFEGLERRYLTAEEVQAKEWGYNRVSSDSIATDAFYAQETPPALIAAIERGEEVDTGKFEDQTTLYVNNRFREASPSMIAHRSCVEIIRGPWRLTYDIDRVLDEKHSKIYSSGCVEYYF